MKQVCALYSAHRPLRAVALADWEAIHYKDYHGDHAGRCETSQLMALRPDLVDLTRMPGEPYEGSSSPLPQMRARPHGARGSHRRQPGGLPQAALRRTAPAGRGAAGGRTHLMG